MNFVGSRNLVDLNAGLDVGDRRMMESDHRGGLFL
jgi:hypothetical protein